MLSAKLADFGERQKPCPPQVRLWQEMQVYISLPCSTAQSCLQWFVEHLAHKIHEREDSWVGMQGQESADAVVGGTAKFLRLRRYLPEAFNYYF